MPNYGLKRTWIRIRPGVVVSQNPSTVSESTTTVIVQGSRPPDVISDRAKLICAVAAYFAVSLRLPPKIATRPIHGHHSTLRRWLASGPASHVERHVKPADFSTSQPQTRHPSFSLFLLKLLLSFPLSWRLHLSHQLTAVGRHRSP